LLQIVLPLTKALFSGCFVFCRRAADGYQHPCHLFVVVLFVAAAANVLRSRDWAKTLLFRRLVLGLLGDVPATILQMNPRL